MERVSSGARPSRRSLLVGGAAALLLGRRANAYDLTPTVEPARASLLLNNLEYAINSLNVTDAEMQRLITQAESATRVDQTMRNRVAAYARDRIERDKVERGILYNLRQLKLWRAPQDFAFKEAIKAVGVMDRDAIASNHLRALARVEQFQHYIGERRLT